MKRTTSMKTRDALYIQKEEIKFCLDGEDFKLTRKQWDTLIKLNSCIEASFRGDAAFIDEENEIHILYLNKDDTRRT